MFTAPIPEDDADRLATLYRYSILDTEPEQGFEDVTTLASEICGTRFALISFVDLNRQWFKSEVGLGAPATGRAESFCACALTSPEPLIVEDTLLDPRFAENPLVLGEPGIRFYAGAPLVASNGHVLGTVCVFDSEPRSISESQVRALKALSRQVMSLLEARLRLLENERAAAALMQQEKLAVVGRLASSMAHEINNPLEAVTNLLWLSQQRSEDAQIKEWLSMADRELRRVSTIANQALRVHKQSSGPRAMTCDVLFSGVLAAYESRIRNAGIEVEKRQARHRRGGVFRRGHTAGAGQCDEQCDRRDVPGRETVSSQQDGARLEDRTDGGSSHDRRRWTRDESGGSATGFRGVLFHQGHWRFGAWAVDQRGDPAEASGTNAAAQWSEGGKVRDGNHIFSPAGVRAGRHALGPACG